MKLTPVDLAVFPPRPIKPQMVDMAQALGMSVATVSRAFHGSSLVSQATRDKVQALAQHWGYTVNAQAQNLRLGHNNTVALVIPYDPGARQAVSDPFFLSILGRIADALTDAGYDMLVSRVSARDLAACANLFSSGRAGGIVMIGQWLQHSHLNELAARGVPIVVWGAKMPDQAYCGVGSDNERGGYLAAEHLIHQGRTQLVFMGDVDLPEVGQRYQGFCQAIDVVKSKNKRKVAKPLVLKVSFEGEQAASTIGDFFAAQPVVDGKSQPLVDRKSQPVVDGIFAASDLLALTALRCAAQHGVQVPKQLSVVGFDDVSIAAYSSPALTTIHQPLAAAALAIVDNLVKLMRGEVATSQMLPVHLVTRQSS